MIEESQTIINWTSRTQIWANVATIINSIVVVISLIYLARQVKISTKATKGATYQTIINAVASIETRISQDKEVARIYQMGAEDSTQLDEIEKVIFNELISSYFNFYENLHFQADQDLVDKGLWKGWSKNLIDDLQKPGISAWWDAKKEFYSDRFKKYVDKERGS